MNKDGRLYLALVVRGGRESWELLRWGTLALTTPETEGWVYTNGLGAKFDRIADFCELDSAAKTLRDAGLLAFRRDWSLSREEWKAEFRRLHRSLLAEVFLADPDKPINSYTDGDLDFVFDHTNYTPAVYLEWHHSPHNPMTKGSRGQKAREKRWKKWAADNEVMNFTWTEK